MIRLRSGSEGSTRKVEGPCIGYQLLMLEAEVRMYDYLSGR